MVVRRKTAWQNSRVFVSTVSAILALAAMLVISHGAEAADPANDPVSFARDVKPLLARHCYSCHGPDADEGGLRLHEQASAIAELDSEEFAIVPGDVDNSVLLSRIVEEDESMRMPLDAEPLTSAEIVTLRRWIESGARFEKHWAFIPPRHHAPPPVERTEWLSNEIDAFILAQLEAVSLGPVPPADRRTLARRAYFDLTGLPPTLDQLANFVNDTSPNAYDRLITNLLASKHYGEHWGRKWLDLVRFAETNSYERDGLKANAWRYRDYVIRSLNDDKPYDQFLREQLAGDELDEVTAETMIATGYYRLGIWQDEPVDPVQSYYDEMDDIVTTTGVAMLGLTINCARCHDHKIDPVPQVDYYGMLAFLADVTPYGTREDQHSNNQWDLSSPEERQRRAVLLDHEQEVARQKTEVEQVGIERMDGEDQRLAEIPKERPKLLADKLEARLTDLEWERYRRIDEQHALIRNEIEQLPSAEMALSLARCDAHPKPMHVMARGNPHALGDQVEPHFPEIFGARLAEIPVAPDDARSAGRRRILAEWIASPENMLTARVIVNRVWQHHFGRGIVRSASNFGQRGTPPTHPELLDWLALWFIDNGWQLKPLHQLMMTSSTYRMSSRGDEASLTADPDNDMFWRFNLRRLSAEELRDATLAVSGRFNPKMYGPGFYSSVSPDAMATQSKPGEGWGKSSEDERARRSVYIHVKRSLVTPMLAAFDFPDTDTSCEARFITTQPSQPLSMLNGRFANEQAGHLAARVTAEVGDDRQAQVSRALELTLGRKAAESESAGGMRLVETLINQHGLEPHEALRYWCLTTLNLNEFLYVD